MSTTDMNDEKHTWITFLLFSLFSLIVEDDMRYTNKPDTYSALLSINWFLTGEFIPDDGESCVTTDLYHWWMALQEK